MAGRRHKASEWLAMIDAGRSRLRQAVNLLYPSGSEQAAALIERLRCALLLYLQEYGDAEVVIARAPGRLNLMGRHIDHQGGRCNMVALDRDLLVVAGRRPGGQIAAANTAGALYPKRAFHAAHLPSPLEAARWREYLDATAFRVGAGGIGSDWSRYVEAPLARLSALGKLPKGAGMNLVVDGQVPSAAGLSSSSAIVVAVMEAACALYGIPLDAAEFVELCGEAEWYVGTRGGAGDHAAIKMAMPGQVVQLDFHPFRYGGAAPLPDGCGLLICNTRMEARKTAGARHQFNHRVACYHLGREWIYSLQPALRERVRCLRDLLPDRSGMKPAQLLRLVAALPMEVSRRELRSRLGSDAVDAWLSTHDEPSDGYPLRGVVLYGLAECERSLRAADLLRTGRVEQLGKWMDLSHDGDRVVRWNGVSAQPYRMDMSDAAMARLIAAAEDPASSFDLADVPGYYGCSTPDLDAAVDIARGVDGVLGAQLSGAGLGGCIMVLARRDALARVAEDLAARWYRPRGIEPDLFPCNPSAGSGIITLES
ncbi:MAG: galactokinase family protein [Chthonomonadales bacterium]